MKAALRLAAWLATAWPLMAAGSSAATCATCHPKQVSGYRRTGMAKSLFRPVKQVPGSFTHALSETRFKVESTATGIRQSIERNGLEASYPVAYVIGSGNHASGYLTRIGDYLFQSPVSYYSKRAQWDMAPGYERDREPDFTRPVTVECLLCHSGQPKPVADTMNRYESEPFAEAAISCDRCHGSYAAHLAKPGAGNIVNPAKLPERARDSVCEQCHLGGEARIPNPGRKIAEFQPGQNLEEIFSVYVFDQPRADTASGGGIKVVSHVEQLAQSLCVKNSSGKMWCGTCHDPHDKPADPARYYRTKCLGCHTSPLAKSHPSASGNCVACHMPQRPALDGGHTAFTDHRITRVLAPAAASASLRPRKLVAWREPAAEVAVRNLGLANVLVGERDESAPHMDAGFRGLTDVYESRSDDPAVLTSLGLVILRKGGTSEAARLYERAVALDPAYAPYRINAATAWAQAGEWEKAIGHLETAIRMDPSLERAYLDGKVHVHDLHATILHLLGLDHERLTYRYNGRDFRLTDVYGGVVRQILS
jgi:hypothetical protein